VAEESLAMMKGLNKKHGKCLFKPNPQVALEFIRGDKEKVGYQGSKFCNPKDTFQHSPISQSNLGIPQDT